MIESLSTDQADFIIRSSASQFPSLPSETVSLASIPHRILIEDVMADRDFPPYDRVAQDGIAIDSSQFNAGVRSFQVQSSQLAGAPQSILISPEFCIEVTTGSVLPQRADSVIPIEKYQVSKRVVTVMSDFGIRAWQNVHRCGSDAKKGSLLIKAGTNLKAPHLGVLAAIGLTELKVQGKPRVSIINTGDELVDIKDSPKIHQVRSSNGIALQGLLSSFGFTECRLEVLPDSAFDRLDRMRFALKHSDVVLITGGISAGIADFVASALADLGVKKLFHGINIKPGKPLWYGVGDAGKIVFGLPGNPVASLICARRFVIPALRWRLGLQQLPILKAKLKETVSINDSRTVFLPVRVSLSTDGQWLASPLPVNGSGDLVSLANSDGFLELKAETKEFQKGDFQSLYFWSSLEDQRGGRDCEQSNN